jgi:hypothetical protein
MRSTKALLVVSLLMTGLLAAGCPGKKRIEGVEAPTQPQTTEPVTKAPETNPATKYSVIKGDTLWGIAGMSEAYKDNFEWPLIFKANRDQIKDPDLIYPAQEFLLRHDYTSGDTDKARKDASDTPKYVPHTKPRETLPVDYF